MVINNIADALIAPHIKNPLRGTYKFITITDCQHEDFSRNREDTALIAVLLGIRHHSMSDGNNRVMTYGSRYGSGQSGNSRQRTGYGSSNRSYDRIATFGDTKEKGKCFCVILESNFDSQDFFVSHCHHKKG
jgi:hypothetical protein